MGDSGRFIALLSAAGAQPPGDAAHPQTGAFPLFLQRAILPALADVEPITGNWDRQSPWPCRSRNYDLMTALAGSDAAEAKIIRYLTTLYAKAPPDLIVCLWGAVSFNNTAVCFRGRRCCWRRSIYAASIKR